MCVNACFALKAARKQLDPTLRNISKLFQQDQINMTVFFWYFINSDLSSVRYYVRVNWTSRVLQGTRITRPSLSGRFVPNTQFLERSKNNKWGDASVKIISLLFFCWFFIRENFAKFEGLLRVCDEAPRCLWISRWIRANLSAILSTTDLREIDRTQRQKQKLLILMILNMHNNSMYDIFIVLFLITRFYIIFSLACQFLRI